MNWFSFLTNSEAQEEMPDIFPMPVLKQDFVAIDVKNIYSSILTDVVERTEGVPEDAFPSLWDNCLKSESAEGLITMLSKSMLEKSDLFLVWNKSLKLITKATRDEEREIRDDYKSKGTSAVGTYVSFKNLSLTDMVRLYSGMEYCAIASLNKNMNLSSSIQFKMNDMRGSVALNDKAEVQAQAQAIAKALGNGKDILTDAKDSIETATPDVSSTKTSLEFINQRRSFYLGLPESYVSGILNGGLGDSGEADARAIERGLKKYYFSILKPVLESLFGITTSFKSEDHVQLDSGLNALKTFELTSEEFISAENKLKLINKIFNFPEDTKGGPPAPDVPLPAEF